MPRVRKGAARAQARKRLLRLARGFYGARSKHKWKAKVTLVKAGVYKYRHRRLIKRDMRSLWITRLTAACKMRGTRYSVFVNGLRLAGIILNRKMLSELAIHDPKAFDVVAAEAVKAVAAHKKLAGTSVIKSGIVFGGQAASTGSSDNVVDIEGIGPAFARKLAAVGVRSIGQLREAGKTAKGRDELAAKTGIKPENVTKWAFASDFFRLSGMDGDQAELLVHNGVKTVAALAKQDAAQLAKKLIAGNKDAAGKLVAPRTPSSIELGQWIGQAKALPEVVTE
jgi:large subunit ribosomal protein L20